MFYVKDVLNSYGGWDLEMLRTLLPNALVEQLRAILIPTNVESRDEMTWSLTPGGDFSVKSVFELLWDEDAKMPNELQRWRWIWQLKCTTPMTQVVSGACMRKHR